MALQAFLSVMLFRSCAYSVASEENVKRVFKLLKRPALAILNADMGERSRVLFEGLN